MSWATAGNLLRISERAREATGWTYEAMEARDHALATLPKHRVIEVLNHLRRCDLSPIWRTYSGDESQYEESVRVEFERELARWREMRRWIAGNVEDSDASRDPQS